MTQAEQNQQHRAYADGGIRQVERRVIPVVIVDLDEIGDLRSMQAVDKIAQRTANHHRKRQRRTPFASCRARQPDYQRHTDDNGQADEEPTLPTTALREEAES